MTSRGLTRYATGLIAGLLAVGGLAYWLLRPVAVASGANATPTRDQ